MKRSRLTDGLVSLFSFACCLLSMSDRARADDCWSSPPVFDQPRYEVFWNVSGPGLHSFELTGYAYDLDANQTVTIDASFLAVYTRFSSVDGNPATFSFRIVDVDSSFNGGILNFGLGAWALEEPVNATGTFITVHFVPEPGGLLVIAPIRMFLRRQRD